MKIMMKMSEWMEHKLNEVYDFSSGLSKPRSGFGFGFDFLSYKEIFHNYFIPDKLIELVNSTEKERKICSIIRGDVFLTRTSETDEDLGMSCIALKDYPDATFNGFTKRLRPNGKIEVIPEFAGFYFRNQNFRAAVSGISSITTRASLNNEMLASLSILVPPIEEQQEIAEVLMSLHDKIDLLHRPNNTLEQLAETLFRKWFVEESEVSWEEKRVWDIAEHFKENINPSKYPDKIFHHFSLPAFDEGKNPKAEIGKDIFSNKYKVIPNPILISKLNPRFPRIWELYGNSIPENSICSTEFQIAKPKDISLFGFLYCFLKSNHVTQELVSAAGGTSGSHQRVNPNDIFNLSFIMPPKELIERFHLTTKEYFQKIKSNAKQIKTLTQLRDTLLPKLMNGKVRVN
jgi:type I restriction enzyme S subunit